MWTAGLTVEITRVAFFYFPQRSVDAALDPIPNLQILGSVIYLSNYKSQQYSNKEFVKIKAAAIKIGEFTFHFFKAD